MASLKQIAGELGISYTLVSKVLNGRLGTTGVSDKTRDAILRKAKELQYTPNRLAVALKAGRKGAVGIFLHHLGSPGSEVSDRLLRSIAKGLEKSGYRMWLRFFTTDEEFLAACDERLKNEIDGLIVGGVEHGKLMKNLREMDQQGLPIVSVFSDISECAGTPVTNVAVDYEMQGFLAARHLLQQGCRHLAHFRTIDRRYKGFLRAHSESNVKVDPKLVIAAKGFAFEDGKRCLERLLKTKAPFDGIVCQSDAQAVGVATELAQRGVDVPGAVKLTGIDNCPLAEYCITPVTSVTSGMQKAGLKAVELLLKRIDGQTVSSVLIEPELVERKSSSVSASQGEASLKGIGEGRSKPCELASR
jgi:LacI family transcriptional regulator